VVRQGFYDYTQKIKEEKELFQNRQYIFFKSKNEAVKKRLLQLDFPKLAQKNTITPGFGKHDVVMAYNNLKNYLTFGKLSSFNYKKTENVATSI